KAAVDTEATKAKSAIDKATDQAGVDSAKAAGKQAIENVPTTGTNVTTAKEVAKKAVDETNSRKVATELPNTGTTDSTVAVLAAVASAMLGLSFAGRRRKDDEEA
ncbi:LPXTG cell wall anchor domain-containing protein, partial [Streptococcus mitis]|uniref:LPXTG cell wall anchor domain-containing protein n=1 Tax=Streptococcus mitis TaxID=28037 RepID=UPI000ABEC11C